MIILLLSLIMVVHLLFGFITPVLMATVIVSIFKPTYNRLLKELSHREYLAASIATFLVFLGVLIPLAFFMFSLVQQAFSLFEATQRLTSTNDLTSWMGSLREYLDKINAHLSKYNIRIASDRIMDAASTLSQTIGQWIYDGLSLVAANLLNLVINFLLTVALVFIFFINGQKTKRFIMDLVPLPEDEKESLVLRFRELSHAVFVGNGLISLVQGILGGLSFWVFGLSGAIFWGFVITITAFLPLVGCLVVIVPAAIYLFLIGETSQALTFLIFNIAQTSLLETFVKPRLIGNKSHMHAALVFMSILAGIQIYGFFGLFYGPLLVTIFLSLAKIYQEHYRDHLHRS